MTIEETEHCESEVDGKRADAFLPNSRAFWLNPHKREICGARYGEAASVRWGNGVGGV